MADERPNAEHMLARIQTEESSTTRDRGRLKVFVGYAAGVGKTYAMLEEARARAVEGVDVVIGYAEPHGRSETEALLLEQEVLPPREIRHRNITLGEFDLDAALVRKPALIVVDELAHTNAPGQRHAKRYLDVLTLLQHGINVYTTVNVQHLESLNDVVAQITGVRVRETVPDNIFDEADEIELIDIPPDELLERFEQGKVYVPDQATRAAQHFFKKPNLIALREIALRKTADRVNAQVQIARIGQATGRTWPTRERMLVCIGPSPTSAKVIRSARRMAAALHAEWIAVTVETPGTRRLSDDDRDRLALNLQLAERLGAETSTLSGESMAGEIIEYANSRNVTKIVIGKPNPPKARPRGWLWDRKRTVVDEVLARSGEIDVYVIRGFGDISRASRQESPRRPWDSRPYIKSMGIMALATAAAWLLARIEFSDANIVMVLLLGVAAAAAWYGLGPAMASSVVGGLIFNFFFTEPYHTFAITDSQNVITFFVMMVIAIIISTLTSHTHWQAEAARRSHRRTELLYRLSRRLVAVTGQRQIVAAAQEHLRDVFDEQAVLFLPDGDGRVEPRYGQTPDFTRRPTEIAAAQWVFEHGRIAGIGTDTLPNAAALYLPLEAPGERIGVLAVQPAATRWGLSPDQRQLLETFSTQVALALQREKLADQAKRVFVEAEAERTRNMLLSSVSHDLRTPLATIAGASSSLFESNPDMSGLDDATRNELAHTIYDESNRLSRLIENLLHMTRLESGSVKANKQWQPLEEVVGSALQRAKPYLHGTTVVVDLPNELPMAPLDGVLIEQVLINLLDNAAKYGDGSPITLRARADERDVTVEVLDRGPGLPVGQESRVFDKFYRTGNTESSGQGAGLGLAICRAIIEAHNGRIWAENRPVPEGSGQGSGDSGRGGTRFAFTLPLEGQVPQVEASGEQPTQHPS